MKQEIEQLVRAIVRDCLSALHRPIGEWRFRKAAKHATAPLLVSAGAARRQLKGWLNTDISWRSDLYLDLTKPWPLPTGSVARIYADNVIEHFPLRVGRRVLRYAFDALDPGGRIRLATPDVERTARVYLEDPDLTACHLERHRRCGYDVYYPVELLRVTFSESGHHLGFCYDWYSLSEELQRAGFVDIDRFAPGESNDPRLRNLEARTEPTEAATSLIVEGHKPWASASVVSTTPITRRDARGTVT
jgi:predicted SAM-dependent methyltransferase